ncbi:hypothetical protein LAZ67_2001351 [Cordylochernes scorpioides]|uniref:Transposase n=1 Tax=Cordylochernes scorpioides TaxID=51811 RepID=A0ABY6K5V1_9ARAC|nr:hypothetical protein LAZ67_2001351 [Cordylochernes scorpioides]
MRSWRTEKHPFGDHGFRVNIFRLEYNVKLREISSDLSLVHRYWSCRYIRPLIREAFTIIGRPPDLQGWVFGHGLADDALAILTSAKTRIYRSNPAAFVERRTSRQRGIMVWGAIANNNRSPPIRIEGIMTAQRYVDDVLRPVTLSFLQETRGWRGRRYPALDRRASPAAAKKNSAKDIPTELCQVYGEGCTSSGMVRRWVREFKNSRTDVHDEPRAGRPSVSDETIAKVEAAMLVDRRVTVRKLCDLVPDVSKTTIDKVLRPIFVRLYASGTTINSDRYCETLKQLRHAIQNERRGMLTKGVCFHQDNARPHTARQTTALIEEFGWELVSHPPYSPDVATSDVHLFPELKKNLGGTQFQDDDELEEAVLGFLRGQAAEFFDCGLHEWVSRMQKCVKRNGEYIEKMKKV